MQFIYGDAIAPIIPILFGVNSWSFLENLVSVLDNLLRPVKTLVIASSDMSHFYQYEIAKQMDSKALSLVQDGEWQVLFEQGRQRNIEFCGLEPVLVTGLLMSKWGMETRQVLAYQNSGDVTGDHERVVGYSGVSFSSVQQEHI